MEEKGLTVMGFLNPGNLRNLWIALMNVGDLRRHRRGPGSLAPVLAALWVGMVAGAGAAAAEPPRVIVIIADTATWQDYTSPAAPFIRSWLPDCAVGLMNVRVTGPPTPAASYLTLGAGSRAAARTDPALAGLALNPDERYHGVAAHRLFRVRMGVTPPEEAVCYLGLPSVAAENAGAPYSLRLGLLGQALGDAGLETAAVGNADLADAYRRQVVTIVMNQGGLVALGDVGDGVSQYSLAFEPPIITDYTALLARLQQYLGRAAVIAVETGDLSRLAEARSLLTPSRAGEQRAAALARLDGFVREVASLMRGQPWRLYLVSPTAGTGPDQRQQLLAPVIAYGSDLAPGLLTSPSTRRSGIVTNMDLAPSVLEYLGVTVPPEAVGRAMSVQPYRGDAAAHVMRMHEQQQRLEDSRPYVLKTVSGLIAAVFFAAAGVLLLAAYVPRGIVVGLREAALFILALPLAGLLLPASAMVSPGVALLGVMGIAGLLYAAARGLGRWRQPWAWLAGAALVVLCVDVATGQRLVEYSLLSYSAAIGARYYGLGNELGGVLLAAAPLGIAGWVAAGSPGRATRVGIALVLAGVVVIFGHPAMGANFGIAIAAALGFGLAALALYDVRLRLRHLAIAGAVALVAAGVVIAGDWLAAGEGQSHIGRAMGDIRRGGMLEAATIFSRKAALNWLLVRHSISTWVLAAALAAILGATMGRNRAVSEHTPPGSALGAALLGAGAASAASFVLNDSGLLSAAWGFTVMAAVMVYIAFDWRLRQGGRAA